MTVNPLVNWIWLGFGVMALGTGLALLPESALAFAAAKVPAGAATTSMILLLLLVPGVTRSAQTPQAVRARPAQAARRGDHLHLRLPAADERLPDGPNCHGLDAQRAKLDKYVVEQGMDRDQVLAAFAQRLWQPGDPRRADRQGLQPARLGLPVSRRRRRRLRRGRDRAALVAPRRPTPQACGDAQDDARCAPDWTMSSATSINGDRRGASAEPAADKASTSRRVVSSPVERRRPAAVALLRPAVARSPRRSRSSWRARHAPSTWC